MELKIICPELGYWGGCNMAPNIETWTESGANAERTAGNFVTIYVESPHREASDIALAHYRQHLSRDHRCHNFGRKLVVEIDSEDEYDRLCEHISSNLSAVKEKQRGMKGRATVTYGLSVFISRPAEGVLFQQKDPKHYSIEES